MAPDIADKLLALSLSDPEYLLFCPSGDKAWLQEKLMTSPAIYSECLRRNRVVRLTGPGQSPWTPEVLLKRVEWIFLRGKIMGK